MLAAAAGQPYHIPYGGRADMQYAPDVARALIRAMRTSHEGADAYNIRGSVARMTEVIDAIEEAEPTMRGQISFDDVALPYPEEMDDRAVRAVMGDLPVTPLTEGVQQTIGTFKRALDAGKIAYDGSG